MRLKRANTWLGLTGGILALPLATPAAVGQADNIFDASSTTPVTLDFNNTTQWDQGGPENGNWGPDGTAVDGSLLFRMAPVSGTGSEITVNNIDSLYTGISSLTTSQGTANSSLTLEGSGGFLMDDASGLVDITPTVNLNLEIDIEVACDLLIDTSNLVNPASQSVNFREALVLTQPGATLRITGGGSVVFETGSSLEMTGTLEVGQDAVDQARLEIESGASFNGAIDLLVNQELEPRGCKQPPVALLIVEPRRLGQLSHGAGHTARGAHTGEH